MTDEIKLGVSDKYLNVIHLSRRYKVPEVQGGEIPLSPEDRLRAQIAAALAWASAENVPDETKLQAIRSVLAGE